MACGKNKPEYQGIQIRDFCVGSIIRCAHIKISQIVTGLLPQECLNNTLLLCLPEQHCWTNNIVYSSVSTILLSNDEATRLFMVVETGNIFTIFLLACFNQSINKINQ